MGTSLSGLTPATTFDGLLKTSDNDALDATLKTIGTGDGTDSVLQLSNSALQIGGATTIVGGGNDATTTALLVQNTDGTTMFRVTDDKLTTARFRFVTEDTSGNASSVFYANGYGAAGKLAWFNSKVSISDSPANNTAKLQVKGSGATSATTSLLVQNSAGSDVLQTLDNGSVGVGGPANSSYRVTMTSGVLRLKDLLFGQTGSTSINNTNLLTMKWNGSNGIGISGNGAIDATARLHVKGSGNDNTTTSLLVQNSDATELLKVTDDATLDVSGTLTIQRSAANFAMRLGNEQRINGFIDAGATNILSLSSAAGGGNDVFITPTGIGVNQSTPTAKLQVKGNGATSATTALLVQNSAGTELLKVNDDGNFYGQSLNVAGVLKMNTNQTIRFSGSEAIRGNISSGTLDLGEHSSFTNTRVFSQLSIRGTGNTATTTALLVQNSDGADLLSLDDEGQITVGQTDIQGKINIKRASGGLQVGEISGEVKGLLLNGYDGTSVFIGRSSNEGVTINNGGFNHLGASLGVKGFGATSATTALLVENSAGTELMKVLDDGSVSIGSFRQLSAGSANFGIILEGTTSMQFKSWNKDFRFFTQNGVVAEIKNDGSTIVGGSTPDASAKRQVDSTTQGFLPPRMTTTERDAITTPAAGLMVYNTTTNKAQCYNGTAWQDLF